MSRMTQADITFALEVLGSLAGTLGALCLVLVRLYIYRASKTLEDAILAVIEKTYIRRDIADERYAEITRRLSVVEAAL